MQFRLIRHITRFGATAAVLLFVQACGGGGGGSAPAPAAAQAAPPATATPDVPPVTVAPVEPVAPIAPVEPLPPIPPVIPVPPLTPVPPVAPAPVPAPVLTSPVGGGEGGGGLDYQVDAFAITTPVTGAKRSVIYYSDKITVTGLSPGVWIHCIATGAGYVDAGADALSGTYGPVVQPFQVSPDGTFVLKVRGVASGTPGATVRVIISIVTFSGYGETYYRGTMTTEEFTITTES